MRERTDEGLAADALGAPQLATVSPSGFVPVDEKYPAIPPPDLEMMAYAAATEDICADADADADAGSGADAATASAGTALPPPPAEVFVIGAPAVPAAVDVDGPMRGLLLAQDIAEIARAREALLARDLRDGERRRAGAAARTLRTDDSVPIILGCVLAALMMIMVGAAAMFVSFAR